MKKFIIAALLLVPMSAYATPIINHLGQLGVVANIGNDDTNTITQKADNISPLTNPPPPTGPSGDNSTNVSLSGQGAAIINVGSDDTNTINQQIGENAADVNQTVSKGDSQTLRKSESYTNQKVNIGDRKTIYAGEAYTNKVAVKTLNMADSNAQVDAANAQNNSESYTNKVAIKTVSQSEGYTNVEVSKGDATTLKQANSYSNTVGAAVNQAAQADANAAQSNSEAYTSQSYQQANINAQNYAQQAQNNAENFAQGAANQAQRNADQYAASGIAAALAMPSSPYLRPGHYAVGIQAATYGGEQGFGARATYQINNHWSANAGLSGGSGEYGQVGATVGVQYEG